VSSEGSEEVSSRKRRGLRTNVELDPFEIPRLLSRSVRTCSTFFILALKESPV